MVWGGVIWVGSERTWGWACVVTCRIEPIVSPLQKFVLEIFTNPWGGATTHLPSGVRKDRQGCIRSPHELQQRKKTGQSPNDLSEKWTKRKASHREINIQHPKRFEPGPSLPVSLTVEHSYAELHRMVAMAGAKSGRAGGGAGRSAAKSINVFVGSGAGHSSLVEW